jgi:hypothetical protein
MNSPKTNNSFTAAKIYLRLKNLPEKETIKVLDCYHWKNVVWGNVKYNTTIKIDVHGIDIKEYENQCSLLGDNIKILPVLDLSGYDIIDLDAYGVPDKQIKIVCEKAAHGTIVFYTFIQSVLGMLPLSLLMRLGFGDEMIKKVPTLFSRDGFDKFKSFLSTLSITKTSYIKHGRKYYGFFIIP